MNAEAETLKSEKTDATVPAPAQTASKPTNPVAVDLPRFGGRVVESIYRCVDHTPWFGFMDFVSRVNTQRGLTRERQKCRAVAQ